MKKLVANSNRRFAKLLQSIARFILRAFLRVLSLSLHISSRWLGLRIWSDSLAVIALLSKKIICANEISTIIFLIISSALTILILP
jgi:hypothetical protein